jgi:RNA processing factor Prp31
MTDKTRKTKKKRLPQGLRKHIRRLKQEARKEGTVYRSPIIRRTPAKQPGNSF